MNDGMPGMNNHCYTEATGHPANRNCSSGWTKQQRAPVQLSARPCNHRLQRATSTAHSPHSQRKQFL